MQTPPPPQSEEELLQRCQAIAGLSLQQLAEHLAINVPADLKRHKGWVGQLLELALGADARSLAEPDFRAIGVELKTVPVDTQGKPRESTYVCTVPLDEGLEPNWESSWICRKLSRVLWLPVEADPSIALPARRIGSALLWSPDEEQQSQLRRDWEELTEMICMGELEQITARMGTVLQIRPKAANSRVRCRSVGAAGEAIVTNPRGYYLRPAFTRQILQRHYCNA
ncbi:MAG TPA: DNA mismatch repair endonuclease MutH [Gammaproteobacteria bacterium]